MEIESLLFGVRASALTAWGEELQAQGFMGTEPEAHSQALYFPLNKGNAYGGGRELRKTSALGFRDLNS